jgi:hypothetical protein
MCNPVPFLTTGELIFNKFDLYVAEKDVGWKRDDVCSNGWPSVVGKARPFITQPMVKPLYQNAPVATESTPGCCCGKIPNAPKAMLDEAVKVYQCAVWRSE